MTHEKETKVCTEQFLVLNTLTCIPKSSSSKSLSHRYLNNHLQPHSTTFRAGNQTPITASKSPSHLSLTTTRLNLIHHGLHRIQRVGSPQTETCNTLWQQYPSSHRALPIGSAT